MIQYLIKYLWNRTINSTTQLIKKRPLYIHSLHSENIEITFCLYQAALKTSLGFYIQSSYLAPRYNTNWKPNFSIFISYIHCSHIEKQVRILVFTFFFLPRLRKHQQYFQHHYYELKCKAAKLENHFINP